MEITEFVPAANVNGVGEAGFSDNAPFTLEFHITAA
jgi:hypothetical protein